MYEQEIDKLTKLEETTLTSDLTQGYALKSLTGIIIIIIIIKSKLNNCTIPCYLSILSLYILFYFAELLAAFFEQPEIKQHYKSQLLGSVLGGYLSLRKLVVQRTKLIDETQEKLLGMLEQITTGV